MLTSLLILPLIFNLSFGTTLYHEILSNENELLPIQPKKNNEVNLLTIIRPCFNIHCKPDQECTNQGKKYECVTKKKSKKKHSDVSKSKCDLVELKLSFYEYFEAFEKKNPKLVTNLKSYSHSIICQESVLVIFNK